MKKVDLVKYMNEFLQITSIDDISKNGLQVDSDTTEIKKIGYAVDASVYLIDKAIKEKIDMLIVHHGEFRDIVNPVVGLHFERIKRLIRNNICMYGVHLPLDAHPTVGNNAILVKEFVNFFKLKNPKIEKFGFYHGESIGFALRCKEKIDVRQLQTFCKNIGIIHDFHNYGNKEYIQSVAFVTGSANDVLIELMQKSYDLYITGELKHSSFCMCKEIKQSVLLGGHYETEVFGVRALAQHLEKKFKIKTVFLDEKY